MKIEDNDGINEIYLKVTIQDLEEENKQLKEKIELLDNENMCLNAEIKDREEEIKKLKDNVAWYEKEEDRLREENKKLKEELAHYKNTDAIQNSNRKSVYTSEEQELLDLDYGTGFTAKFVRK